MAPAPFNPADFGLAQPPKKGPSLIVQGGLLVGLTVLAAGMGWFGGGTIKPAAPPTAAGAPAEAAKAAPAAHGEAKEGGHAEEATAEGGDPLIVPLAPITTNLAAPADTWLRVELALQFKGPPESGMADTVAQDVLAYLRTLKLHQLQGASSFLHLKADLDERAQIRSGGKVAQVFVRALIME